MVRRNNKYYKNKFPKKIIYGHDHLFDEGIIYAWKNLLSFKIYIGQTIDIVSRLKKYMSDIEEYKISKQSNTRIIPALAKYSDQFIFEIIGRHKNVTRETLTYHENQMMLRFDSTNPDKGYNILGGDSAFRCDWCHFKIKYYTSDGKPCDHNNFHERILGSILYYLCDKCNYHCDEKYIYTLDENNV